jgi:myo-inositol-1(or 4)-monophosphatase
LQWEIGKGKGTDEKGNRFIGEETYSSGSSKQYLIGNEPTWCVDPLDGTVNYTHLFPMFCVSIAFCLNGIPVVGVVYQPVLDTCYSAVVGGGAWFVLSSHSHLIPLSFPYLFPTSLLQNVSKEKNES